VTGGNELRLRVLGAVPVLLLAAVMAVFGAIEPRFLQPQNLMNIAVQASSLAIVAAGMTFVLLTAGVDLSAGSVMFLAAAAAGKLVLSGIPPGLALLAVVAIGVCAGLLNGLLVAWLRLLPFVVTLATLYLWRGFGLEISQTRAMNLPEDLLRIGAARFLGVPAPIWCLAVVLVAAQVTLARTAFGRQVYAVGIDAEGARRAGVQVAPLLIAVYTISGLCAAFGGLVSVAQLGAVSPTFGSQREFAAIAAAVLGGASLFGGRGSVFPGTLAGALLIQSVENGLVLAGTDPYLFPIITAAIIFAAVFLDAARHRQLRKLSRRRIRVGGVSAAEKRTTESDQ
jgi:ribose transport system permease protein